MATTVQNSDKKYLNFDGLAYYDGKLKKWIGDNYAPIAGGSDAAESMRLWNEFLAGSDKTADGKLQALPTLKSLNDFKLDMNGDPNSTDNNKKIGRVGVLEATVSDYSTVKSNAANSYSLWEGFLKDLTVTDNNPAPTLKVIDDRIDYVLGTWMGGVSVDASYVADPDLTQNWLFSDGFIGVTANSNTKTAQEITKNYGRLGLAERNLQYLMGVASNLIGTSLTTDEQYEISSSTTGRVGNLEYKHQQLANNVDDELYYRLNGGTQISKLNQIVGSVGTSVIDYGSINLQVNDGLGLVYKAATANELQAQAVNFAGKIGDNGISVLNDYGRLGLAEANLSFTIGTFVNFSGHVIGTASDCQDRGYGFRMDGINSSRLDKTISDYGRLGLAERYIGNINYELFGSALGTSVMEDVNHTGLVYKMNDLYGDSTSTDNNKKLGRVGVLEKQIGGLTGAVHFKGAVTDLPTLPSDDYTDGDIIVIAGATATPNKNGKEYILSGGSWVELGDTTQEQARIGELEKTINGDDSKAGLVDIVGDANSGLVKDVNDIQKDYVKYSDLATEADIDTLFATTA